MWKGSRFNVRVPGDSGEILVVNTLNRGVVRLVASAADVLNGRLITKQDLGRLGLETLVEHGYLVPQGEDELRTFSRWHEAIASDLKEIHCTVAVTSVCNLACPYCFEKGALQSDDQTMSLDTADRLVRWVGQLAKLAQSEKVSLFFYGGEPTLVPSLLGRIVEMARSQITGKRRLSFGIYTNGTRLTRSLTTLFRAGDFRFAQVSLDGPPEVHNQRRRTHAGEPTFADVWHAVEVLCCECGIPVKVVVNFDKDNHWAVPSLLDLICSSPFGDRIQLAFNPVFVTAGNRDYCVSYAFPEAESHRLWKNLREEATRRGLKTSYLRLIEKGPCSFHRIGHFFVSPRGKVFECIGLLGMDDFATADVHTPFDAAVLGQRQGWIQKRSRFRNECMNCPYLPICLGGCRFKALCETDSLAGRVCHKELIEHCELPLIRSLARLRTRSDAFDADHP